VHPPVVHNTGPQAGEMNVLVAVLEMLSLLQGLDPIVQGGLLPACTLMAWADSQLRQRAY
jgi:hypothetical protein